jgi:alkylation response protein AidB-like acyl-CoA dehydrogenase
MNTIMQHGTEAAESHLHAAAHERRWTGTMCLTEPQCGTDLAR